jgi:hypothetical protein
MKTHKRPVLLIPITMIALALAAAAPPSWAQREMPFGEANLFFELNDTDGDLGIHALIDGEPWKSLEIEDPSGRAMLNVSVSGRLRQQGLTELFFESAEPPFDELSPQQFFRRFPEGKYEIDAVTLEGGELAATDRISHVMPGPAENVTLSGTPAAEDCDANPLPSVSEPVVIQWGPVTESHPEIGTPGRRIEVDKYQVVIEREGLALSVDLPPDATEFEVPAALTEPGDEIKFEILVRAAGSGNQTAVESCFIVR